eukprot:TRINITY_DN26385_c0_g1_i2.p1 TRINITY_DN26385_c0_g1~~TRINITY_DN26385_c0_g1_i2.p1  ORF type:complete len:191 (-),score=18.96 TRINITY_DN26385_c0_g1_i2:48-542(-)
MEEVETSLDSESFCSEHRHPYTQYCKVCEKAFCNECPLHSEEHPVISLLAVITPEALSVPLEDTIKVLEEIDFALAIIPRIVDSLQSLGKLKEKSSIELRNFTTVKEEEKRASNKLKALAIVTGEYDCLKLKLEKCLEEISKVKVSVDVKYLSLIHISEPTRPY